ncbi:MAG: alpha/beta hydrolase [Pseudomonadota bacterium]
MALKLVSKSGTTRQTLYLRRDQLTLTAWLEGPESAPLVMLVHGFPDTPSGWDTVAQGLLAAGYRVLRPWLRGYTPSSVHPNADYDAYAASLDLLAWQQELGGQPVHLIGHDWGAIAAMAAVASQPSAWQSLTILAIPPFQRVERAWRLLPTQLRNSAYMLEMQSLNAVQGIRANDCARLRELWQIWSPGWAFTPEQFAPVPQAFLEADVAWAATRYYRALFTPWRGNTRMLYALARRALKVPTLALTGAQDGCMQAELFDVLVDPAMFPAGIQCQRLPDCGHFLQVEQPQAVLLALLPHLVASQRLAGPSGVTPA